MPVPMIAPMPSSVRSVAVNAAFQGFCVPRSTSPTSCSIDLVFRDSNPFTLHAPQG
jgi:hypothetical protein